jgi:thiamine-monophosphate kinase
VRFQILKLQVHPTRPYRIFTYYESMGEGFKTTVLMASEVPLIERVRRKLPCAAKGLRIGIGDDAAVMASRNGAEWVVTADAFLENVHFLRKVHPPRAVGYKALARATSDLAAMGAKPKYFLMALALPPECTTAWLDSFLDGMATAAHRFGLTLAGGDTTKYPTVLVNLTVIGEIEPGQSILRSGARPGDLICVSGRLGEAELGWRLVQQGLHKKKHYRSLLRKHFHPEPRLALGRWLAERRGATSMATSMIDTSDGLSTDLGRICESSGVGARLYAEKIPVVDVPEELRRIGLDPLKLALDGGEDYELLFTVPKKMAGRLPKKIAGVPVRVIGEIKRGKEIALVDAQGLGKLLRPGGWDSFRN